jgi:hypothetical protein
VKAPILLGKCRYTFNPVALACTGSGGVPESSLIGELAISVPCRSRTYKGNTFLQRYKVV